MKNRTAVADPAALVIAIDAGWTGTGWAICTSAGPIRSGRKVLPSAESEGEATRARAVKRWLAELELDVLQLRSDLEIAKGAPTTIRTVIERIPWVYDRGNQAAIGWGQGRLFGLVESWGTRDDWLPVWPLPPLDEAPDPPRKTKKADDRPTWPPSPEQVKAAIKRAAPQEPIWHGWRPWWGLRGNRAVAKAGAIRLVRQLGWGAHLEGLAITPADAPPAGDVAEAILIGVGAARNPQFAPNLPGADFSLRKP